MNALIEEAMEELSQSLTQEQIQELSMIVRVLGTLDAVVALKTTDTDKIAQWLYLEKEMVLPIEKMKEIAEEGLITLRADGLIVDDEPTPQAIAISMEHQMLLHSEQLPN